MMVSAQHLHYDELTIIETQFYCPIDTVRIIEVRENNEVFCPSCGCKYHEIDLSDATKLKEKAREYISRELPLRIGAEKSILEAQKRNVERLELILQEAMQKNL